MPKLNFIHICENAFVTEGTKSLNLIGMFDGINSPGFPAVHPKFSIVANVDADTVGKHTTTLLIKKDNKEISKFIMPFDGIRHQIIQNLINYPFPEEGTYRIDLFIDGVEVGGTIINLRKVEI